MKTCTKCHETKPLDAFHLFRRNSDGHQSVCKVCRKAIDAERWANDTLGRRTKTRIRDAGRTEEKRAYYHKNREILLPKSIAYNKTPQGRAVNRKAHALYDATNREQRNTDSRKRAKEHPELIRAYAKTRRARVAGALIRDLTAAQWAEIQAAFDHRCAYCGKRAKGHLTQDHITPITKGGNHTLTNVIPACSSCNSKKHTGPPLCPVQPLLLTLALPMKPKD